MKRCLKTECCKQYRYVKTKWAVQEQTHRKTQKHVEHHDATDIQKKRHFFVFRIFIFYFYNFLNDFFKNC